MNTHSEFLAVAGTVVGALALAAAAFVYRTAPDKRIGTRFGLLLLCETVMVWTTRTGPLYWLDPDRLSVFWARVHIANDGLLLATYLPALAVTIHSQLLAPFQPRAVAMAMFLLGLVNAVFVFALPDLYLRAADGFFYDPSSVGPAFPAMLAMLIVSYVYGLIATLIARVSASGPLARRRATLLAFAFGTRDLTLGVMYSMLLVFILFGATEWSVSNGRPAMRWVLVGGFATYICLTAYGVASSSLFDIDLKLKWTLERGTVAAILVAVFFMVSEAASTLLSDRLGSVVGILATGILVFALAPLQRAAEKMADQAMPSVQDTPEYRAYRKLQVYGEAYGEAMRDGSISAVERVVLNRLRAQLALDDAEADALEQQLEHTTPAA